MISIREIVRRLISLRASDMPITLLAVCPNSDAVLEAAVRVATVCRVPMLFAATLNQVDCDGGYTGWTPEAFVTRLHVLARDYGCTSPLYPCLDHGGPWLKDAHAEGGMSLEETMAEVRASLTACLRAGYALLHVDPTVDRSLPSGQPPDIESVVGRTVELISYAESERWRMALPPVSYEVGTEEVHGGLADLTSFDRFLAGLRSGLEERGLSEAWPCFVVGKVGTDLHTTTFDADTARRLYERVSPFGSLIKGHYTDWVSNPEEYPASGMGGANVGPEFTSTELSALRALYTLEERSARARVRSRPSEFMPSLEKAVFESGRWKKWLLPGEAWIPFDQLDAARREWLVATGARYVWTNPQVLEARERLFENVRCSCPDPHSWVVEQIARSMERYVDAFNLRESLSLLTG